MDLPSGNPWSVLELEAATATERDVKKAYARLLKLHRPETDPAGFQRLHSAYQLALDWLRSQSTEPDETNESIEMVEFSPAEFPAPEPELPRLSPALQTPLDAARSALDKADQGALLLALTQLRQAAMAQPHLIPDWEASLTELFPDFAAPLLHLTAADLYAMISANCHELPSRVLELWFRKDCSSELVALARMLTERQPPLDSTSAIHIQSRLALFVAFSDANQAEKLANLVYTRLPLDAREWVMTRIDQRIAMAKLFGHLPHKHRRFWERKIFHAEDETVEWLSSETVKEFKIAVGSAPEDWRGVAVLSQSMPKALFDLCYQSAFPTVPNPQHKPWSGKLLLLIALLFLAVTVRNVSTCKESFRQVQGDGVQRSLLAMDKISIKDKQFVKSNLTMDTKSSNLLVQYGATIKQGVGSRFEMALEEQQEINALIENYGQSADKQLLRIILLGETKEFVPGYDKHLTLCTRLMHDSEKHLNLRYLAMACLKQHYPTVVYAEALLYAAKNSQDPIFGMIKAQADIVVKEHSADLSTAQRENLSRIAAP